MEAEKTAWLRHYFGVKLLFELATSSVQISTGRTGKRQQEHEEKSEKERDRKRAKGEMKGRSGRKKRAGEESKGEERAKPTSCHHLGPSLLPGDVAFT